MTPGSDFVPFIHPEYDHNKSKLRFLPILPKKLSFSVISRMLVQWDQICPGHFLETTMPIDLFCMLHDTASVYLKSITAYMYKLIGFWYIPRSSAIEPYDSQFMLHSCFCSAVFIKSYTFCVFVLNAFQKAEKWCIPKETIQSLGK